VRIHAAAIQIPSAPSAVSENLERADAWLDHCRCRSVELAVLPEMFNTGYGLIPDYAPLAETWEGPTLRHLSQRSRQWKMAIAAGFVERDGRHLYDALGFCLPDGRVHIYRKRHLVFWEGFRFRPGRHPLVVETPWGRLGFAVCADMIYRGVWDDYRGRIDLAIVSAAWPEFACRESGRRHWLLGRVGPLSREIPARVAEDLGVPVVFANQCGPTRTAIPLLGARLADRFAGSSSVCDGRSAPARWLEGREGVVISTLTLHSATKGTMPCHFTFPSVPAA
jgi:N-carbamoylputrescine amidase